MPLMWFILSYALKHLDVRLLHHIAHILIIDHIPLTYGTEVAYRNAIQLLHSLTVALLYLSY